MQEDYAGLNREEGSSENAEANTSPESDEGAIKRSEKPGSIKRTRFSDTISVIDVAALGRR